MISRRFDIPISMTTEKPKRRWYQFSLRTLLVFMLLFSIGMSWFAVKLQQARKQREIVQVITELGGGVSYDYGLEAFPSPTSGRRKLPQPLWLVRLLGRDFFVDVDGVHFYDNVDPKDFDALFEQLKQLPELRRLVIRNSPVTDAELEHLKGLTSLKRLSLVDALVTDAGLEHLKGLTKLKFLELRRTDVSDKGAEELRQALPNCKIECWNDLFLW